MSRKKETVYAICPLPLGDTARFFWVLLEQDLDEHGALWNYPRSWGAEKGVELAALPTCVWLVWGVTVGTAPPVTSSLGFRY